ncbi:casparian strip membrane protein 1-like [Phoenix dactylifera]|uniref:CASP-like protein n=1 Tax=Phoenix dactylifera TaxID=42345 RepID=A0A8B8ZHR2_PHODC|nr:casparian strip membrane protein 1-like [Phoenix dactylifera]
MGTTDETLPFFAHYYQFHAEFSDLPALLLGSISLTWLSWLTRVCFRFSVVGNAIAAGYLVLPLPFSIISICRPQPIGPWLLLLIFDTVSNGSPDHGYCLRSCDKANWVAICLHFDEFCQQISAAVVVSFVAVVLFMVLVVMSALAMRKP